MKLAILSDDLTGASGVSSMINMPNTITINCENLKKINLDDFDFVSINLNLREKDEQTTREITEDVLDYLKGYKIALRIDSTLRGNVSTLIKCLATKRNALLTDTIPEYERYTVDNSTVCNGERLDLLKLLNFEKYEINDVKKKVEIRESKTLQDLRLLADACIKEDLAPIDPGPMISLYAQKLVDFHENQR